MQDSVPPLFRPVSETLFRPAGPGGQNEGGLPFQNIQQDPGTGMAEELANSFEGPTFWTSTNAVFSCYAFYAALLILKMLIVALMTVGTRMKKKSHEKNQTGIIQVTPKPSGTQVIGRQDEKTQSELDMRIGPGGINHISNTTKDGQNVAKDGQTGTKQDYQAVVKEDEPIAAKGEIAVKNGPNAKRAVQTVLQMTDKGVSYLKSNLPPELKPAALKTNLAAPAFKYVRDQITLKKLAYLAFELVTAKLYFKLGLGILYGLANLAWKRYREEKTEDVTTKAGERSQVFVSPEDTNMNGGVVSYEDPDIERLRRAHLNDLENIPGFLIIALLYIMTDPGVMLACWLIRIYTLARFLHTIVYGIYVLPQPSRALCFTSGVLIEVYMIVIVIMAYHNY